VLYSLEKIKYKKAQIANIRTEKSDAIDDLAIKQIKILQTFQ
jgi:hypothetical protein